MIYNKKITIEKFKSNFNNNEAINNIKVIAHNTFDYLCNGQRKIRYTDTDIIIFNKNYIKLFANGFYTNTTKKKNKFIFTLWLYIYK